MKREKRRTRRLSFYHKISRNTKKTFKRLRNKRVRQCRDISNHGNYRKIYDYWWDID